MKLPAFHEENNKRLCAYTEDIIFKEFGDRMKRDIALFYYYSSPSLPEECFLELSNDIAYRNMFLLPCAKDKIHFEFPVFEDHSYNTICNRKGVRSLIQRPSEHEKYIIFRTRKWDTNECNVIGYYHVRRAYYQETKMFNNNGFVWGIEAGDTFLVKKGAIIYDGPNIKRGYRLSWKSNKWNEILTNFLERIKKEEDISGSYKSETNRLIELFKDEEKMNEWKEHCQSCENQKDCTLYRRFKRYNNAHPNSDIFSVINKVYKSNLYSRNELNKLLKIDLR